MVATAKEDPQQSLKQKWLILKKNIHNEKKGLVLFYKIFSQ